MIHKGLLYVTRYLPRSLARNAVLARQYRTSFLASLLVRCGRIPFVVVDQKRGEDANRTKADLQKKGQNIGWAIHDKTISASVCGHILFSIRLQEGEELTAQHFYFNRPVSFVKDAISALKAKGVGLRLEQGMTVFEPGCGCAKYLHYFSDRYGMVASGYDVYRPAVAVAEAADIFHDVPVREVDLLKSGILHDVPDRHFDLVFVSSYLPHVMHHRGFAEYFGNLMRIGKQFLIIEPDQPEVRSLLEQRGFVCVSQRKTLYCFHSAAAEYKDGLPMALKYNVPG